MTNPTAVRQGPPPIPQKPSGLASASFIIAMVGLGAWLMLFVVIAASVRLVSNTGPLLVIVCLSVFACMAANLAGAIFGIVAMTRAVPNRS